MYYERFGSLVITATVSVMFFMILFVAPWVSSLSTLESVASLFGTAFLSLALYRGLSVLLMSFFKNQLWLRKYVLERSFIEGTWVGLVSIKDQFEILVIHIDQESEGTKLIGSHLALDKTSLSVWKSDEANVNIKDRLLRCAFSGDILESGDSLSGSMYLKLLCQGKKDPPKIMDGYIRFFSDNMVCKIKMQSISEQFLDQDAAFTQANQLFVELIDKAQSKHNYNPTESKEFYDQIASGYDERNSSFLRNTHRKIIEQIKSLVSTKESWSVLDFGGGTGIQIANQFATDSNGSWLNVDASIEMVKQFKANMSEAKLNTNSQNRSIARYLKDRGSEESNNFDIVLFSLVLSSMKESPDWLSVLECIKPGGALLVADIEPAYVSDHPLFSLDVGGDSHALRIRKVYCDLITEELLETDMVVLEKIHPVMKEYCKYSYVAVFKKKD